MSDDTRHLIAVRIDQQALNVLLRDGATVRVINGIPKDAKLLGIHHDSMRLALFATFEHPSFPPCPLGERMAEHRIGFEVIEHPMADMYDMIPLKINMNEREYFDMRGWICEQAAAIEGREYPPKARSNK